MNAEHQDTLIRKAIEALPKSCHTLPQGAEGVAEDIIDHIVPDIDAMIEQGVRDTLTDGELPYEWERGHEGQVTLEGKWFDRDGVSISHVRTRTVITGPWEEV